MSFAHLTLATRDVEKSREFFINALGWQPVNRPGNIGLQAAWLSMGPDQELHLVHVADFEPSPFEKEFGRHLAVAFPLTEFPELKRRLEERGAELIEPIRETPFERFFFRSPEGYMFEVVDADRQPETE
ncbi:MAG: catechol 2,3-dioxygenase-like lactoylglutathione lyase family enzyme [Limisphaerales bacterium]|jgi:catechol 2,3-dioxygenase-like lactoylglutathione lyase family enzyme